MVEDGKSSKADQRSQTSKGSLKTAQKQVGGVAKDPMVEYFKKVKENRNKNHASVDLLPPTKPLRAQVSAPILKKPEPPES